MKTTKYKKVSRNFITYAALIVVYLICQLAMSGMIDGFKMSRSLKGQLVPICVYIVMAVSLNLTVGIAGELSLGHAGFMSVGAFTGVVVSQWLLSAFPQVNLELVRLLAALVAGGCTAAITGVLIGIPVLRLRGDYLAIVTLAFGEIIRNLINCVYIALDGASISFGFLNPNLPGKMLINGPMGATGVKKLASFNAGFLLVMFTLIVVLNLINSRSGRAIMAIRDNRIAAESVGINVTKYRMLAFVVSAALAGMAGALYGLNYSTIQAVKFKFDTSILILVFVVLGGIGNIRGSIIAATVLTVLPEMLREFGNYRMLIYSIVLILVMLVSNNPMLQSMLEGLRNKFFKKGEKEGEQA
ncbi:MAG: branched-chain amino acid ABC transporter permease [Clostridia bacterium]|nr:branched-chain amino acid ABC transporter permease [Clostridia bacterium]